MLQKLKYISLPLVLLTSVLVWSQEPDGPGDVTDYIKTEVENINPVYKPIIGLGIGTFNYFGEVRTANQTPYNGDLGFRLNVATYIDNNHYIRGNFFLFGGSLSGEQRSHREYLGEPNLKDKNLNFKSTILAFGVNLNYDFDHFIAANRRLRPFVSIGAEIMTFDTKTDLLTTVEGAEVPYFYWSDGSIRGEAETGSNLDAPYLFRDYNYETDVKDIDLGLSDYPQYAFAIPVDVGLDFQVTDRVMFRVGTSLHYTFSDEIDHISNKNTAEGYIGDALNDMFTFSYFTIHLDLFSSDKTLEFERLFYELELDLTLIGDEDGDGWFDAIDECPGTPFGVETDTLGCPIDSDLDGIPDYQDDHPNSRYGAYVDERGVELTEDEVIASLDMSKAVPRSDIAMYIRTPDSYSNYRKSSAKEIPEKFKTLDIDNDGYISFDEMMDAVDSFFDFESDLNSNDIYELNDFFFSQ
ncbi:MAG TPA: hypothetical protein DDX98_01705 [Bacteroidales bacterium]|jgi:hypothetical protein|nr:hypothetical protein [Bacteroidales bacterium]